MKEYDVVEVIADKKEYKKEKVFKGMFGVVMSEKSINGKWQVIFSDAATGRDIADIGVHENDLKIHGNLLEKKCNQK